MKENNAKLWIIIVIVAIVAGLVGALLGAKLTGNVISVAKGTAGKVYTTDETYNKNQVDSKLANLKGTCQYIHYKDTIYTGYDINNITVMNVCQKVLGGFIPKIIVETESQYLYNVKNCPPSSQIFGKTADNLISYKTELASVKLGQQTSNACNNALFPDGRSNGNFSTQTYRLYSGVLCCKN